jgi:hypothetical protein
MVTWASNYFGVQVAGVEGVEGDADLSNGEAWCDINAANCVCSEPLTATRYLGSDAVWADESPYQDMTNNGTAIAHNPNDTTSNECGNTEGSAGYPIVTYPYKLVPSDTEGVWDYNSYSLQSGTLNDQAYDAASLPNRVVSQTPRFLGIPPKIAKGIYFFGHEFAYTTAFANHRGRRAIRWYIYYPDDYAHIASGEQNTKMFQSTGVGYWSQGNIRSMGGSSGSNAWTCNGGATTANPQRIEGKSHKSSDPTNFPQVTDADYAGKWWRYEWVIDQANQNSSDPGAGEGVRLRMFAKNVSDGWPEFVWLDSYANTNAALGNDGTGYKVDGSLYPDGPYVANEFFPCGEYSDIYAGSETFNWYRIEAYTQSSSDTGTPQKGYAFMQVAAWTQAEMDGAGFDLYGTDAYNKDDFRIGSAYEMEGVAGNTD